MVHIVATFVLASAWLARDRVAVLPAPAAVVRHAPTATARPNRCLETRRVERVAWRGKSLGRGRTAGGSLELAGRQRLPVPPRVVGSGPEAEQGSVAQPTAEAESKLPDWVGRPPQADSDGYRTSLTIGPYTTRAECDAKLPDELQKALNQYVYVEKGLGEPVPAGIVLPESEFRQAIVKAEQEEVRRYSVGPMVSLHVLLEFDGAVKERILEQCRQAVVGGRIWMLGAGLASLLAALGVLYGYLTLGVRR
jgi:hypothetical protein